MSEVSEAAGDENTVASPFHLIYLPPSGKVEVNHFTDQAELVAQLKQLYTRAELEPVKLQAAQLFVVHGQLLPVAGDRERTIALPDGTTVEIHPGPPIPAPTDPFALIPDSWLS